MGFVKWGIVSALVILAGIGIYFAAGAAGKYNAEYNKEKIVTINVTKTWVDAEVSASGKGGQTFYLVSGKEKSGNDRVIELRETYGTNFKNIDIEMANIQVGKVHTFSCIGFEDLPHYTYLKCIMK